MLKGNKVILRKDFEILKRRLLLLQHHYSDCFVSKPVRGCCSVREQQIKVQVPKVCGASSGSVNVYREDRFSFQPFSRNMTVQKLFFDPSELGVSPSTIWLFIFFPLGFFRQLGGGCMVCTGDAVLSISLPPPFLIPFSLVV